MDTTTSPRQIEADMNAAKEEYQAEMASIKLQRRSLLQRIVDRLDKKELEEVWKKLASL